MAIVRVEKTKNYSVIANTGLRDERLSWKARGILAYLLTLPDGWTVYLEEVEKHSEIDGRESFRNGIKELKKLGYFETVKEHDEKGHFETVNYAFETPRNGDNPKNGKPVSRENRLPDNTTLLNTNQSSTDSLNTDKNSSSSNPDPFYDDIQKYKPVSQFYQENFHFNIPPADAQALDELVDRASSDLVIAAMTVAVKEDAKRVSYVEGIINNWLDANVTTVEEAREYVRKWQARKKGMTAGGKARTNVSNIRSYHGRSQAKSYEESLREVAAAKAVWN